MIKAILIIFASLCVTGGSALAASPVVSAEFMAAENSKKIDIKMWGGTYALDGDVFVVQYADGKKIIVGNIFDVHSNRPSMTTFPGMVTMNACDSILEIKSLDGEFRISNVLPETQRSDGTKCVRDMR